MEHRSSEDINDEGRKFSAKTCEVTGRTQNLSGVSPSGNGDHSAGIGG